MHSYNFRVFCVFFLVLITFKEVLHFLQLNMNKILGGCARNILLTKDGSSCPAFMVALGL